MFYWGGNHLINEAMVLNYKLDATLIWGSTMTHNGELVHGHLSDLHVFQGPTPMHALMLAPHHKVSMAIPLDTTHVDETRAGACGHFELPSAADGAFGR